MFRSATAMILRLVAAAALCSTLAVHWAAGRKVLFEHDLNLNYLNLASANKCLSDALRARGDSDGGGSGSGTGTALRGATVRDGSHRIIHGGGGSGGSSSDNNDPVDRFVTKQSGPGWQVWDRRSVLHEALGRESPCDWNEYKAAGRPAGLPPVFACVYPKGQDTWVSGLIRREGRWGNCDALTGRLVGSKDNGSDNSNHNQGGEGMVYMDVGANIGSCVLQILATTRAHVVAFEPSPKNLFRLTSTLLNLPDEMKGRVTLFPVALGSGPASVTIVADPNNAGNTQVVARQSGGQKEAPGAAAAKAEAVTGATVATHNIPVERMDDLLSKDLHVDLLKMDVQGYECFVLSGMRHVLANTRRIFFEVEEVLLGRFKGSSTAPASPGKPCSGSLLVRTLQRAGFRVHNVQDLSSHSDADLRSITFRDQDMYGERAAADS
jgi:FkbM family methyltransferase